MTARRKDEPHRRWRRAKAAALAASLMLSALVTAVALRAPEHHWLAWISFLPLFVAVRSLRPLVAALAGGLWGACLYVFCTAGPASALDAIGSTIAPSTAGIGSSAWLLVLLIVIPGVYVGLAARPARAIGFKLLTLALGWTLIEAVLHFQSLYGPHNGPLTGSQAVVGLHHHWLARLLAYVCTAFLVACTNASLIGILTGARLSFPPTRSLAGSPNVVAWAPSEVILVIQSWTFRQTYPRAPPIQIAAVR